MLSLRYVARRMGRAASARLGRDGAVRTGRPPLPVSVPVSEDAHTAPRPPLQVGVVPFPSREVCSLHPRAKLGVVGRGRVHDPTVAQDDDLLGDCLRHLKSLLDDQHGEVPLP